MQISQLKSIGLAIMVALTLTACQPNPTAADNNAAAATIPVPAFNADSAYAFTQMQVDFGPRVTGSDAHRKCGDWAVAKFKDRKSVV